MLDLTFDSIELHNIFKMFEKVLQENRNFKFGQHSIKLNNGLGSGSITGIQFPRGVVLWTFDIDLKKDLRIVNMAPLVHPLKFLYCISGSMEHRFNSETIYHTLDAYKSAILGSYKKSGHEFYFKKGQHIEILCLEIDREAFTEYLIQEEMEMEDIFYKIIFDVNATKTVYHESNYSLELADIFKKIKGYPNTGFTRTNFLGGKALEILSLMLEQYKDDVTNPENSNLLRINELNAINMAVDNIDKDLADVGSVKKIASDVGLTQAKLQNGFKTLFKLTANEYIKEKRLEKARALLRLGDRSISEVMFAVGFSSPSYFSKIFKERFGISASKLNR